MPVKESKELLEALDAMKKEANKENAEKLSKLLDESIKYKLILKLTVLVLPA